MEVPVSLYNAVQKVLGQLSSLLKEKYDMYLSFEDDLFKLRSDLTAISKVLIDAEKQQERNSVIKDWLETLQIVLHDAEDLFADLNAEALRQDVEAEWWMVTWVKNVYFLSGMDDRIKKLLRRIDRIKEQRSDLLRSQIVDHDVPRRPRDTLSSLRFTEVVGREEHKKEVIELLFGGNSHEGLCVVPIVGIGGLGKTALAHLVFDDEKVKNCFDLRIWVDVYDDLSPNRIMQKQIIRAVDGSNVPVPEMNTLSCLQDKVSEKKFLLVLDDVWNCNMVKWLELKKLLGNGGRGSGILLTTRTKSTAEMMGRINLYSLSALPDDECWSLFEKWAFGEGESVQHPNLKRIGEDIVNKCGGVPLAIRTVGGLLSVSKEESYWRFVKDSDTWDMGHLHESDDGILSVLKLSYDQLPSHLKECFAYCSLLPKGKAFDKQDLILLWMAQGFIHSSNGEQQLEDIGSWYVNEFVSRSIFDVVHENHKAEIVKCRMHYLLHDLAKSVAGNLMVNSDATKMSESIRHVSFWDQKLPVDLSRFLKLQKLRTLQLPGKLGNSSYSLSQLYVLLSGSTYLRALDLSNSGLKLVPNSIGNMKHLRYLNLNGNTELQALPESICRLHSLETLKLSGCIKISTFPRNFPYLVSLRYLVITSPFDREKRVGTLTSLRWLTLEHCRNLVSLSEVTQHLNLLRTLCIHNCDKLTSLPRNLENCTALETLEVVNCRRMRSLEVCMQGLSSLRSLTIKGLPKLATLPNKLECYATSLQYLFITDCNILMTLPNCLGNLSSLMRMYIKYCHNLQNLPRGFSHLTALQVLQIDGCPNLSTRCRRNVGEDWKQIAHVPEIFVDNVKI
ncbi:hypothetical protein VNO77_38964 [Canavalia gladiata]|uniref:Disease resistance protein RGA3 n=1 Tax=Canavalia gladiata TaxID=3824 RepID=A0AAN9KC93_CANGL